MVWQPLHVRIDRGEESLHEGAPPHLRQHLQQWIAEILNQHLMSTDEHRLRYVCIMVRLSKVPTTCSVNRICNAIRDYSVADDMKLLTVIDALLHEFGSEHYSLVRRLERTLLLGNSAWALAPDRLSLTRRIDPNATEAIAQVAAPHDAASNDLLEAWRSAYGQATNPSDAWDHSIKAVEHILGSIVSPTNNASTLGTIIRDLKAGRQNFQMSLTHKDGNEVDRLIGMLELMWPNPDRHGGGRITSIALEQAQAIVHLAVTVVQWARAGVLIKEES